MQFIFFFKQKTAYEMRISDWSSDVCSSDLVGVAMGSGTDVARESADVVLLGNDLVKFAGTLGIARRTRRIIWFNFAGTIGIDLLGIALASAGLLNPLLAPFIHVASEMALILNSARLLQPRAGGRTIQLGAA